jgi:hypothetical protein
MVECKLKVNLKLMCLAISVGSSPTPATLLR